MLLPLCGVCAMWQWAVLPTFRRKRNWKVLRLGRDAVCQTDAMREGNWWHSSLLYWLWLVSVTGYWLHMRRGAESSAVSWYYWTLWRPTWSWIILKYPVRTAQSTHFISVIQTRQLMLYREIIAVCSQIHIKHITQITFKYPVRTAQ